MNFLEMIKRAAVFKKIKKNNFKKKIAQKLIKVFIQLLKCKKLKAKCIK